MGSVLKHFPGYGNNVDTHTGIAYDNRTYETFLNSDFLPFQAGIDSGANMVLVSHNVVSCMDSQTPASLSSQVHKILREELKFTGVIITDDLAMDGVRNFAEDTKIAVQAVKAGNDMLCCTDFEVQIPAILEAVKQGEITEERIDESVLRILELKISLGII
jgi:beta-N-acetylhexosaminidase